MLVVDPITPAVAVIDQAARWLARGGVVAFPTDTLYGLACDVRQAEAVRAVFDVKGRGAAAALPLIAASVEQVEDATGALSMRERAVIARAWPGPLALVRPAASWMAPEVHADQGTVAIRVPDHTVARALAGTLGSVIAATSANRSGAPPTDIVTGLGSIAEDPRVLVIDGGRTPGGLPSTIVDLRGDTPVCVREGAVPWTRVLDWLHA